jgi:WhiB family redox-sensing transcriptional regulator
VFSVGHQDEDDWHSQAECYRRKEEVRAINKKLGYDMFFPEKGDNGVGLKHAKKFCGPCPVTLACLTESLDNGERGTWGGEREFSRKRLMRLRNTGLSELQVLQKEQLLDENKDRNEVSGPDPAA